MPGPRGSARRSTVAPFAAGTQCAGTCRGARARVTPGTCEHCSGARTESVSYIERPTMRLCGPRSVAWMEPGAGPKVA
jgi:hypothetical protein